MGLVLRKPTRLQKELFVEFDSREAEAEVFCAARKGMSVLRDGGDFVVSKDGGCW
jgi:hypothetical protein